jgi:hypothetical protein
VGRINSEFDQNISVYDTNFAVDPYYIVKIKPWATLISQLNFHVLKMIKTWLIDWLFAVLRPAQEYFTYMETSPFTVRNGDGLCVFFFLRFQTKWVQQRTFCVVKSWLHEKNGAQIREEVVSRFNIPGGNIYMYQIWPTFFEKCYTNLKGR